ncbi:MAG: PLP-dependent aminotransferase family protein [Gammaproteobacteria bacterium]|nr:PLP-dependent aminotransferase family protein [Gammaproteobacteria bacterium]
MMKRTTFNKVTFDGEPPKGVINLGIGQPSADLLPAKLLHQASEDYFRVVDSRELNYGEKQGDIRFRESLAGFLSLEYGVNTRPESLFLSCGNSQALDFICERFTQAGDTVFVEEPTYFLAFQIFRDHGLNIVPIPMDEDGLVIDALEQALKKEVPALLYTIPSFSNPGGQTLSKSRREALVELSREYGFVIAADEVYQMLPYFGDVPPALGTMIDRGNVLSMGTFSKIMAPGLRLGWIQAPDHLMEVALDSGWINSGGAVNHVTSHIVRHAIDMGLQTAFLKKLREIYRGRVLAMDECLQQHMSACANWTRPDGGYFFWLQMDNDIDVLELRSRAFDHGVGFQPGAVFTSTGGRQNYLRLSFAHYNEADIREAISRLASMI